MVPAEIAGLRFVRLRNPAGEVRVGVLAGDEVRVLESGDVLGAITAEQLARPVERLTLPDAESCTPPDPWRLDVPLIAPETWAAGVTYRRSREARLAGVKKKRRPRPTSTSRRKPKSKPS